MLSEDQQSQIRARVRQFQLAAIGMMIFVLVLLPLVLFTVDLKHIYGQAKLLTMIAAVGAIGMLAMATVVPKIFGGPTPNRPNDEAVRSMAYSLSLESLIRFALLEGAVFLNLIVFMLEPHIVSLTVAGIGFLLMLFFFPSSKRISSTIDRRLQS